jgi:hypothetical protein
MTKSSYEMQKSKKTMIKYWPRDLVALPYSGILFGLYLSFETKALYREQRFKQMFG